MSFAFYVWVSTLVCVSTYAYTHTHTYVNIRRTMRAISRESEAKPHESTHGDINLGVIVISHVRTFDNFIIEFAEPTK